MNEKPLTPTAVVGIGASAGGLQAYAELLEALPADTGMVFVVVQHLAAEHESFLAPILARSTRMPVIQVSDEPSMVANTIYVIPPNRTMVITDGHLALRDRGPGLHLSVDIFFNALAESHGPHAIAIVLSGTGSDGMKGIEAIKGAGGITFAQNETAQHSGMPESAISTGCIDFVLSPREIAHEVAKLAGVPQFAFSSDPVEPSEGVDAILRIVQEGLGIDFAQYKENTLHRRIRRRMALRGLKDVHAYAELLRGSPAEIEALCQDILISVTSFFRDPESFEALKTAVFPRLLSRSFVNESIRIWSVGCSTGEEAYSFAIALLEYMADVGKNVPLTVFGTDVNAQSIERARRGHFAKNIVADVSEERLKRFFTPTEDGYVINKSVRELCIFAPHNALTDPPFSRMDLVSCRNVLIYFQAGLQGRLLPLIHYALKPSGFLFLGSSESISHFRDLFNQEDSRHKIYARRPVSARFDTALASPAAGVRAGAHSILKPTRPPRDVFANRQRVAELVALKHYAPVGVLVDADGEILQFRGDTSAYLTQADGRASLNLFKIAREGLFAAVRSALQLGRQYTIPMLTDYAIVRNNAGLVTLRIKVIRVQYTAPADANYWIFFEPQIEGQDTEPRFIEPPAQVLLSDDAMRQIAVLSDELTATRDHLESTIQGQEAANEDLQAANEEVQSSNEELQSTNEELETSKEEIQSSNEELTTVNEELRLRNEELDRANDDLNNLFSSVQLAIVMVWRDLRIRRFTPLARDVFNIRATDIGRSISDIHHNLDIEHFPELLANTIEGAVDTEKEVRRLDGGVCLLRLRPYRTQEGAVDGAIVVLIDVDTLAQAKESLRKRVAELAAADRHKNEFLAILAHELRNPLAPLRNAAQILQMSPSNADVTAKARDLIERQVHNMSRLVGDLLDAARAENGQIKLQRSRLDLRDAVERAADLLRPQFAGKSQAFALKLPADPVYIDGDATRLEQVISNLLSNANKYTSDGGNIALTMTSETLDGAGAEALIRVTDDGAGIDAELMPRLFDLFVQADRSLAHSQGGLGIGLSLVRTLVEMHGGVVTAHSGGCDQGSTFEVRLPLARHAPGSPTPPQQPVVDAAAGKRVRRVLIVDDNPDIRESTEMLLSMSGFEVATSPAGLDALRTAPAFKPNAVLIDIGLPDMSGYEVARRLRSMPQFVSTLLIAVSGYDTPEARQLSTEAGFDRHMTKPLPFADLEALLA